MTDVAPTSSTSPSGSGGAGLSPSGAAPAGAVPAVSPTQAGSQGDQATASQPSVPGTKSTAPANPPPPINQATLTQALRSHFAPVADPKFPEAGDTPVTSADMQAYHESLQKANQLRSFQTDMLGLIGKPHTFGPSSFSFTSPEEVNNFAAFASQVLSSGVTPQQLLQLHMFERMLADAESAGARGYEQSIKGPNGAGGQPTDAKVIAPDIKPDTPKPVIAGRIPTTEQILKQLDPDYYKKVMAGEVNLFDQVSST